MATSNKDMGSMMRSRRAEMAAIPGETPYTGPDSAPTPPEPKKSFDVLAPGDPDADNQFEYEPMTDIPGAWVVYPPGVPCDGNEYRVTMDHPAAEGDFAGMQKALDDAGDSSNPAPDTTAAGSDVPSGGSA